MRRALEPHAHHVDETLPARFLSTAFRDDDVIAIAFRRPAAPQRAPDDPVSTGTSPTSAKAIWCHRFVPVATAKSVRYQAWLRHLNATGHDIYVGMNVYGIGTRRRTEANVTAVRHLYADFDIDGDAALAALRSRSDLPPPSFVVHSSRGKFQAIWNVVDFEPAYAKSLLRYLAYELGADRAVHDLNRVLRLPGFYNYKYSPPQYVQLEIGNTEPCHSGSFPTPPAAAALIDAPTAHLSPRRARATSGTLSQSERDWAIVRLTLSAGAPWVVPWGCLLATRGDKTSPAKYAARTVTNALASLGKPIPQRLRLQV